MAAPHQPSRLAQLMDDRRTELRLNWSDVASVGGISLKALEDLRKGTRSPRRNTLRGVDAGLQWEPGSAERVLAGGDPRPAVAPHREPQMTVAGHALASRRTELDRRWANRRTFEDATGLPGGSTYQLEMGLRDDLTDEEWEAFESAYQVAPGTLITSLVTGELVPLAGPEADDPDMRYLMSALPRLSRAQRQMWANVIRQTLGDPGAEYPESPMQERAAGA